MELSLFYFVCILITLLSAADPSESDSQCPTSRRLLLFSGLNSPFKAKKSSHISSSSKSSSVSSPPKYARSVDSQGRLVFIRPQTSNERGHKVRSYSHLLKSKLYTDEERVKLKLLATEKKKKDQKLKKKNITQHKPTISAKTQELVTVNDADVDRCRALLHVDQSTLATTKKDDKKNPKSKKEKKSNKSKSIKEEISSKVKNIKKKVTALPGASKKEKTTRNKGNTVLEEKKTAKIPSPSANKPSETRPLTPPVNKISIKTSPPSQSTVKSKREKAEKIIIIQETTEPFDRIEDEIDDKNNSVVGRAFYFVRNMFQLSDDMVDENHTQDDQIIDITNGQNRQSRKLLSINDDEISSNNDYELNLYLNNEQSIEPYATANISKRQLLSVKTNKHSASSKSSKTKDRKSKVTTANSDTKKPKVGWAYRYRISRYLDAQITKRTGNKNKITEGGKAKHQQKKSGSEQKNKKTSSSNNQKIPKRKLLEYDTDDDSSRNRDESSDQDNVNSVTITQEYLPKRRLLASKSKVKHDEEKNNDNEEDIKKTNQRRQIKSFEELTDPIVIVQSYDRGLYKPRVGWQFRYRVSRYIDSLRENIREDEQRLKTGLQAIKRKTPQELSGRRKRVLDKPFAPEPDELKKQEKASVVAQENKPNAGWRYRYRIGKMIEAKRRGEFIDDDEEKRQARLEPKKKPQSVNRSYDGEDQDLDPELRKINDEGRRVGWAYRYRIRRKLDDLKRQYAENKIPFDLETMSAGKREKKGIQPTTKSTVKKPIEPIEQKSEEKEKAVGWQYRYRVSKMREAQKPEASKSKKHDQNIVPKENLDPDLARLTPEERIVGWQYRYRIRRKLDSVKNTNDDNQSGKRTKKQSSSTKRKHKEKMMKKVEESIEKILNIDDIDETPFMEYCRRTSSYVFSGLVPAAKKSLCLLPLPMTLSFCNEQNNDQTLNTKTKPEKVSQKALRKIQKAEKRAKQFIRARPTKLGAEDKATEKHIDERMKELYKNPSLPPLQAPTDVLNEKTTTKQRKRRSSNEQIKHIKEEEEHPVKKVIGVPSKKKDKKKRFQIIGQEVKTKHKHTKTSNPVTTQNSARPPPPSKPETVQTTPPTPRLRSIAEVIQEQAATILSTQRSSSRSPEEKNAEIQEANEIVQERAKLKTTPPSPPILYDSTTSGDDNDSSSSDDDIKTNNNPQSQNVKESVHDKLDL